MLNILKNFPILHHYFTSFLLKTKLANQSYTELLTITGSFEILGKCNCSDIDCATVYMKRDLTTEDGYVEVFSFNKGLTVLYIDADGSMEFESLNYDAYPYVQEVNCFFEHNQTPKSTDIEAQAIVDDYFSDLEIEEIIYLEIDL